MLRAFFESVILFLIPFAAFALGLVLMRRKVLDPEHWSRAGIWLTGAGLLLVAATLVGSALLGERHTGAFVPAHMENGSVVPGGFR